MRIELGILLIYSVPFYAMLVQTTRFRDSFNTEAPFLAWALAICAMCSASMVSTVFRPRRATAPKKTHPTIGVLPYCSKCNAFIFPRTYHCDICGACIPRHIVHLKLTNSCMGKSEFMLVVSGLALSVPYFIALILETCHSILFRRSETIIGEVVEHGLLVIIFVPCVLALFQAVLYLIPFLQIAITNGIVLRTFMWGIFEVPIPEKPCRNPYCGSLYDNLSDFLDLVCHDGAPGLVSGPRTDAFCEDWLEYRGLDLKPTVRNANEFWNDFPEICQRAQWSCCGGGACQLQQQPCCQIDQNQVSQS